MTSALAPLRRTGLVLADGPGSGVSVLAGGDGFSAWTSAAGLSSRRPLKAA